MFPVCVSFVNFEPFDLNGQKLEAEIALLEGTAGLSLAQSYRLFVSYVYLE